MVWVNPLLSEVRRRRCLFDDDDSCAGGREAVIVRGDVVDGVGGYLARVDDDIGYQRAVEEGLVAEVGIARLAGARVIHGRAKIQW